MYMCSGAGNGTRTHDPLLGKQTIPTEDLLHSPLLSESTFQLACRNWAHDARLVCVGGHDKLVRSLTAGLKVRGPFGPHPASLAESAGRVRWRSARTNPAVLPA